MKIIQVASPVMHMDSPLLPIDDTGFTNKYFNDIDEKALPGAEMYHGTPVEVSEKMQCVIVENHNIFDHEPIGPLYKFIPEQLISFLPSAFLHCYALLSFKDKSKLMELFQQHQECCPLTIVILPESQEDTGNIYSDVLDDPESVPQRCR